jgi:hypothetical protein
MQLKIEFGCSLLNFAGATMWYRNLKAKGTRVERLRDRLRVLTLDYAPFFKGIPGGRLESPIILTDLQKIRRAQHVFVLAHSSQLEVPAEPSTE